MSKSLFRLLILSIFLNLPNSSILAVNIDDDWVIVEDKEDVNRLVERFIIAPECSRYPFGGEEGLKNDLRSSLTLGLAGLNNHRPKDFHNLREILLGSKSPKIFCPYSGEEVMDERTMGSGVLGFSTDADSASFPAIALNLSVAESPAQVQGTLFHELIHWLGYCHYHGTDIAYLAESCFFSKDELIVARAKQLLKEEHSWLTKEYQIEFFRIMEKQNIEIALKTMLAAHLQTEGPYRGELWDSLLNDTDLARDYPLLAYALPGTKPLGTIVADGTQKSLLFNKARAMVGFLLNKEYALFTKNISSYSMLRNSASKTLHKHEHYQLELLQYFSSFSAFFCDGFTKEDIEKWITSCSCSHFVYKEKIPTNCFLSPERLDNEAGILEDLSLVIQTFEIALESGFDSMREKARESLEEKSLRFGEKYMIHILSEHMLYTGKTQGPYRFELFINLLADKSLIMQKIAARALRYLTILDKNEIFAFALKSNSEQVVNIAKDSIEYNLKRNGLDLNAMSLRRN